MPRISSFTLGMFLLVAVVAGILVGSLPMSSVAALIRIQVGSAEAASLPTPASVWSPPPNGAVPGAPPPDAAPDSAATAPPAIPSSAATGCTATFAVTAYSETEFEAVILVTNTGELPIEGWMISFEFAGGTVVTRTSGLTWTPAEGPVQTAHNDATNGALAVGQSAPVDITGAGAALPPISLQCAPR